MAGPSKHKQQFINKELQVNTKLFHAARLARGLSRFRLAMEIEISPQAVRRALTPDEDPRPDTVKKIGEYLGIPSEDWYIPREENLNAVVCVMLAFLVSTSFIPPEIANLLH